jgi:xanthine dehydrogenase YagS FAD-binding subunit
MSGLRTFAYSRPTELGEAIAAVGGTDGDGDVRFLAGGTDLLTLMKSGIVAPERLIDIKRLPELTNVIEVGADGVTLGALTTLAQIETNEAIREAYTALAEASSLAATPQLRNMATIGGNLLQRPRCWYYRNPHLDCWLKGGADCPARDGENQLHAVFDESPCVAVHPSDPAAALVALGASVELRGSSGDRTVPLAEFFALPTAERRRESVLGADEVIVAIRLPAPAAGTRSTYLKAMDRKVWAFAVVGVAAAVRMDGSTIGEARLTLSGVAPVPWQAGAAERELIGRALREELFARVAEIAIAESRPLARNGYKVPLAKALVRRALREVTGGDR